MSWLRRASSEPLWKEEFSVHAADERYVSEGYTALWERGRLDLTVEAVIHDNPKWHTLFTQEDLEICTRRLRDYRYLT
jgi:hypothetical protein